MNIKRKIPFKLFQWLSNFKQILKPFRKKYLLSSMALNDTPFFIVGSGRSGNTLLRQMLLAGNEVCIPPESYIIARAARKFLKNQFLSWHKLSEIIIMEFNTHQEFIHWDLDLKGVLINAQKLEGNKQTFANLIELVYLAYSNKKYQENRRWGDKTPTNALFLDHICSAFPQAQYVHIIRDPRAVYASYLKSGLLPASKLSDKNKIIDLWVDSHQKIERCKNTFNRNLFTVVHYESLVSSPESELKKICEHLDLLFSSEMLSFWSMKTDGDVKSNKHHSNVHNPLSLQGLNRWKQELTENDIALINKRCLPLYERLLNLYPIT